MHLYSVYSVCCVDVLCVCICVSVCVCVLVLLRVGSVRRSGLRPRVQTKNAKAVKAFHQTKSTKRLIYEQDREANLWIILLILSLPKRDDDTLIMID